MSPEDEREFWGDACDDERRPVDWRWFCYAIGVGAIIWAMLLILMPPANASQFPVGNRWVQPYGGCDEAWQAPSSAGARECRDHGWTVRPRLVVGPRGVVRMDNLPHCRQEDGSGQSVPCSWNFDRTDGNGRGASFWISRPNGHPVYHYVWMRTPPEVRNGTAHWSTKADRTRLYGLKRTCLVYNNDAMKVRCPG